MPAWLDAVKTRLGMIEEEPAAEQTLLQQLDAATTLDRTQRAVGFATCAGIGLMLSFLVRTPVLHQLKPAARLPRSPCPDRCYPPPPRSDPGVPANRTALRPPQAPMFILRPTKFAMVYTLSALCSMSR